jgi:hypothetical protein
MCPAFLDFGRVLCPNDQFVDDVGTADIAAMRAAIASVDAIEAATPGKKLKDIKWGPSRAETLP